MDNTLPILKEYYIVTFICLTMDYACTYYSTSQPKTTAEYLRTYMVTFGGITHTSLTIN
jgi:hypothetical protein